METAKARVLVAFEDVGNEIPANKLVEGEASVIEALRIGGVVDPDEGAVAYCVDQGLQPITITGGYLSDKVKERIAEATATEKKKADDAVIKKFSADEKAAFNKSGLTLDAWQALEDADRQGQINEIAQAAQKVKDDAAIIKRFSKDEKTAFEKFGKSLDEWQALPEEERTKLINPEAPAA